MSVAREQLNHPDNLLPVQIGFVKSVPSGDRLTVSLISFGKAACEYDPIEISIYLNYIRAPCLKTKDNPEQPSASESRAFLSEMCLKQHVYFCVKSAMENNKVYGEVYTSDGQDVRACLVESGWAKMSRNARKGNQTAQLFELEDAARKRGVGVWSDACELVESKPVGKLKSVELFRRLNNKRVIVRVEQVRSGSMLRVYLPTLNQTALILLSGAVCPPYEHDLSEEQQEPYARVALFYTELMALNREVLMMMESINDLNQLSGTIWCDRLNLSEKLLEEGLARYEPQSAGSYADKLSLAEKKAQKARLRLWGSGCEMVGSRPLKSSARPELVRMSGRVIGVINSGGGLEVIELNGSKQRGGRQDGDSNDGDLAILEGKELKLRLSSIIMPLYIPRCYQGPPKQQTPLEITVSRMAYDYMRQTFIGKEVQYSLDYIRQTKNSEKREFYSVYLGETNLALELVSKGFAKVIDHWDGESRSPIYQKLLAAENQAQKKQLGIHATGNDVLVPPVNVLTAAPIRREHNSKAGVAQFPPGAYKKAIERSSMQQVSRLQPFLSRLQRSSQLMGVVEKVITPVRYLIWIEKEALIVPLHLHMLITPLLSSAGNMPSKSLAYQFAYRCLHQRNVSVTIDHISRQGDFSGFLRLNKQDFGLTMLQKGYARLLSFLHAKRFPLLLRYQQAEEEARSQRVGQWERWEEDAQEKAAKESQRHQTNDHRRQMVKLKHFSIHVTDVTDGLLIHFQMSDALTSPPLVAMFEELQHLPEESDDHLTLDKGMLVAAHRSSDCRWHRARVERAIDNVSYSVFYVDLGIKQVVARDFIRRSLPSKYALSDVPSLAHEARLAYIDCPKPGDTYSDECTAFLRETVCDKEMLANIQYREHGVDYVVLGDQSNQLVINSLLVNQGMAVLNGDFDDSEIVTEIREMQELARGARRGMWEYQQEINLDLND